MWVLYVLWLVEWQNLLLVMNLSIFCSKYKSALKISYFQVLDIHTTTCTYIYQDQRSVTSSVTVNGMSYQRYLHNKKVNYLEIYHCVIFYHHTMNNGLTSHYIVIMCLVTLVCQELYLPEKFSTAFSTITVVGWKFSADG